MKVVWGYIWASPATMIGLVLAFMAAVSGGKLSIRNGVVEASGGLGKRLLADKGRLFRGGAAMTLGHVIIARDAACMERSREHEWMHVRQFERWGPFLLPVNWAIAIWLRWRGLDPYLDHPFEQPKRL